MTRVSVRGSGQVLDLATSRLFIAGFAGRDEASARRHIDELAAIGVPVPEQIPAFYELDPGLLTTQPQARVDSGATSGEAEAVLIRSAGREYLGIGSDHTDRAIEQRDIAASKAACPKPIAGEVIALPDRSLDGRWDEIVLECTVDGDRYQRAALGTLRTPDDLVGRLAAAVGPLDQDFVLYMGTVPLLSGDFRYGTAWTVRLVLPVDSAVVHSYRVKRES
jgi:Protein of unknown function (DUF2848)